MSQAKARRLVDIIWCCALWLVMSEDKSCVNGKSKKLNSNHEPITYNTSLYTTIPELLKSRIEKDKNLIQSLQFTLPYKQQSSLNNNWLIF